MEHCSVHGYCCNGWCNSGGAHTGAMALARRPRFAAATMAPVSSHVMASVRSKSVVVDIPSTGWTQARLGDFPAGVILKSARVRDVTGKITSIFVGTILVGPFDADGNNAEAASATIRNPYKNHQVPGKLLSVPLLVPGMVVFINFYATPLSKTTVTVGW